MKTIEYQKNILNWNNKRIAFSDNIDAIIPYKDFLIVLIDTHRNFKYLKFDVNVNMNRNVICLNPDGTLKWEITDMTEFFKDKNGKTSRPELPYLRMYFKDDKFICESWLGGGEYIDPETGIRLGKAFIGR